MKLGLVLGAVTMATLVIRMAEAGQCNPAFCPPGDGGIPCCVSPDGNECGFRKSQGMCVGSGVGGPDAGDASGPDASRPDAGNAGSADSGYDSAAEAGLAGGPGDAGMPDASAAGGSGSDTSDGSAGTGGGAGLVDADSGGGQPGSSLAKPNKQQIDSNSSCGCRTVGSGSDAPDPLWLLLLLGVRFVRPTHVGA